MISLQTNLLHSVWSCDMRVASVKEIKQIKCDTRQRVPSGETEKPHIHTCAYIQTDMSIYTSYILSIKSFNIYNPFVRCKRGVYLWMKAVFVFRVCRMWCDVIIELIPEAARRTDDESRGSCSTGFGQSLLFFLSVREGSLC